MKISNNTKEHKAITHPKMNMWNNLDFQGNAILKIIIIFTYHTSVEEYCNR